MVELFSKDIHDQNRRSSKGNQLKFERDGFWYKADYLGYEGLAETVIARLLSFSTLDPSEYVDYDPEEILYNGLVFTGCKSRDFTSGWQLITLERLLSQVYGHGLNQVVYAIQDHAERLRTMVSLVERVTGLRDFGPYMAKVLTVDTLFLNEDRHSHNLAVLTNNLHAFRLCPLFDHGASLLSYIRLDYPTDRDPLEMIHSVRPKTFCESFEEQLDIAEQLYGQQIHFSFTYADVKDVLDQIQIYAPEIRKRILDIIMEQRRRYSYLFNE